jgi:class 3 adenylate cyclase
MKRQLAAILYADVVSYSRLTNLDEEKTYQLLREGLDLLSSIVEEHEGKKIKEAGDAILAEFQSVIASVECAIKFQRQMSTRNEGLTEDDRLVFRVGVNLGEVIHDRDDIYGDGVNLAARIQEQADPGGVYLSGSVYEQVKGKVDQVFDDLGYHKVKNMEESVRIYRVSPSGTQDDRRLYIGWGINPADGSPLITGRCMCSNVRYESSKPPVSSSYCHCRMCQRANSAPFTAWAVFPQDAVRFPNAEPKYYKSSPFGERGFCPNCGSPMTMRYYPLESEGILAVFAATLDHPEDFAPTYHGGTESQMPWLDIHDDLPRRCVVDSINARTRWETAGISNPDDWKLPS